MLASAQKSDGSQSQRLPEKRCTDFLLIELLLTSYSKGESCDRPSRIVVARHPVLQVYNFLDSGGESKLIKNLPWHFTSRAEVMHVGKLSNISETAHGENNPHRAPRPICCMAHTVQPSVAFNNKFRHLCPVHPGDPSSTSFRTQLLHWCRP